LLQNGELNFLFRRNFTERSLPLNPYDCRSYFGKHLFTTRFLQRSLFFMQKTS